MSKRYIGGLIDAFNAFKVANAPTIGAITGAVNAKACVNFCAPSCVGGGAITSYTAVSCPGFKTGTGTTSPVQVTCLSNCTAYTFKVSANNAYGPSAFSAASASATPKVAGTVGIFAIGNTTTTRNKFTFSGCTNASATASSANSCLGAAVGNLCFGIFAVGNNVATTNKYTYSSCTSAAATNLPHGFKNGAAAGNSIKGVFAAATNATYYKQTYIYVFASGVVSSGPCFATAYRYSYAAGNSSLGIFAQGMDQCSVASAVKRKYVYSSCSICAATNSSTPGYGGSATGTSTIGIFALGVNTGVTTTRNKYTYSSDANASATSATSASYAGAATGNTTKGIFALGCITFGGSTNRDKYTYSGDVVASTTASSASSYGGAAASNGTCGVNV